MQIPGRLILLIHGYYNQFRCKPTPKMYYSPKTRPTSTRRISRYVLTIGGRSLRQKRLPLPKILPQFNFNHSLCSGGRSKRLLSNPHVPLLPVQTERDVAPLSVSICAGNIGRPSINIHQGCPPFDKTLAQSYSVVLRLTVISPAPAGTRGARNAYNSDSMWSPRDIHGLLVVKK